MQQRNLLTSASFSERGKETAVANPAILNSDTIFIGWFADTVSVFKKLFTEKGIDPEKIIDAKYFRALKYPGKQVTFLEHHPLRRKEEQLTENMEQESFTVFNSPGEPFFYYFGGDKIVKLMQEMHVKEDEPFEHAMISASIKNAREKLAKKLTVEQPASSQKEWKERKG